MMVAVTLLNCVCVEAARTPIKDFTSSSFHHFQLNLSLYDDEKRPFVLDMWNIPNTAVDKFLRNYSEDSDWEYRGEYFNTLLQSYRTLQAYQTQRFVLEKDVLTNDDFAEAYTLSNVETAISISLSHIIEMISTMTDGNVCFFGDVSFQHVFQFSQGCPSCTLRYYSATAAGHASNHRKKVERLLNFMRDPSLLELDTLGITMTILPATPLDLKTPANTTT